MIKVIKQMLSQVDVGFLYFMLILIGIVILVFLIRKAVQSLLHPIRKVRVQVAHIETQDLNINAAARKMSAGVTMSGDRPATTQFQMNNMGHAMIDNLIYTFYILDKDNKKLLLKIQVDIGKNMAEIGDIGYVTYQDELILGFEKIKNINS